MTSTIRPALLQKNAMMTLLLLVVTIINADVSHSISRASFDDSSTYMYPTITTSSKNVKNKLIRTITTTTKASSTTTSLTTEIRNKDDANEMFQVRRRLMDENGNNIQGGDSSGGTDDLADAGVELRVSAFIAQNNQDEKNTNTNTNANTESRKESTIELLNANDAASDNLMQEKNVFDYGSAEFTLHELEDKLDLDLQSLETSLSGTTRKIERSAAVSQHLKKVINDVSDLYNSISVTEQELHKAMNDLMDKDRWIKKHDLEEEFERLIDLVHSGKVGVDYNTGKLLAKNERRRDEDSIDNPLLAYKSADGETVEEQVMDLERSLESGSVQTSNELLIPNFERRAHTQFAHKMMSKLLKEVQALKEEEDPAVMQLDLDLLKDVVTLAITAAFCGMIAVVLKLPATAGFLFGGMIIGPSCLSLIIRVKQVQTLAQFGSIFLLFEQGLLYSRIYSQAPDDSHDNEASNDKQNNGAEKKSNDIAEDITDFNSTEELQDYDPNFIGALILVILIFSGMSLFTMIHYTHSFREAAILATTVSICSTTVVSDNLHSSRLSDTYWGKQLLKMIAVQDLFMIPLLALPEMIETRRQSDFVLWHHIISYVIPSLIFVAGAITFSRHIISWAVLINKNENDELFSLSIVAYALMMATISEELGLSIEAGAIFSGLVLIKSPHIPKVVKSISSLSRVFGGMYLTSLGMIISPGFVMEKKAHIFNLVFFIGMFKTVIVFLVLRQVYRCRGIVASSAGLSMAQISEGSLVVLARASRLGFLTRTTYLTFIPTICILLALAPFSAIFFKYLRQSTDGKKSNGHSKLHRVISRQVWWRQSSLPSCHRHEKI